MTRFFDFKRRFGSVQLFVLTISLELLESPPATPEKELVLPTETTWFRQFESNYGDRDLSIFSTVNPFDYDQCEDPNLRREGYNPEDYG